MKGSNLKFNNSRNDFVRCPSSIAVWILLKFLHINTSQKLRSIIIEGYIQGCNDIHSDHNHKPVTIHGLA